MKPELKNEEGGRSESHYIVMLTKHRAGRQLSGRAFAQHMRDPKSPAPQNQTQTWEKVEGLLG